MDLIDRAEVQYKMLEILPEADSFEWYEQAKPDEVKDLVDELYSIVINVNQIDAQPVKHGRWEETHISLCKWIPEDENEEGHSFYMAELKCSCCERYNVVTFALTLNKPEFCQLCGARMDGDDADS